MHTSRRIRLVLAFAMALVALLAVAPQANAFFFIECRLAATVTQSVLDPGPPAVYDWDIIMIGECGGDSQGRYSAFGSADGTSVGLGLCDDSLYMTDLDLDVFLFLDSVRGPQFSKFLHERWFAPITTYPVATPFLIEDVSGPTPSLAGAGAIVSRIFLNCTSTGSPSSLVLSIRLK
jgi:hypothetical protein